MGNTRPWPAQPCSSSSRARAAKTAEASSWRAESSSDGGGAIRSAEGRRAAALWAGRGVGGDAKSRPAQPK